MGQLAAGRDKLPAAGYEEYCIDGGNHAQFGSYGEQAGDGAAAISWEEQINIAVGHITALVRG